MLGRIYRYVTLLLGMKPGQHEYKVMGLHLTVQNITVTAHMNIFRNITN